MNTVIVGLGSNINPEQNIKMAKAILIGKYRVIALSRFIVTKAIAMPGQPDFLNGAVLLQTDLTFEALNAELKTIEMEMGRPSRHEKHEPRTIDLDILVFNRVVMDSNVSQRDFLQKFISELMPD
jgi:2-amino-4-hydroxy-6-hydroxymethyldihydropteridine diphosphokinase